MTYATFAELFEDQAAHESAWEELDSDTLESVFVPRNATLLTAQGADDLLTYVASLTERATMFIEQRALFELLYLTGEGDELSYVLITATFLNDCVPSVTEAETAIAKRDYESRYVFYVRDAINAWEVLIALCNAAYDHTEKWDAITRGSIVV